MIPQLCMTPSAHRITCRPQCPSPVTPQPLQQPSVCSLELRVSHGLSPSLLFSPFLCVHLFCFLNSTHE